MFWHKIFNSTQIKKNDVALHGVLKYTEGHEGLITGGETKERLRKFATEVAVDRTTCQIRKLKHPSSPLATSTVPCRKIRAENAYLDGIKQHAINITSSPLPASWPNLAEKIYFLD